MVVPVTLHISAAAFPIACVDSAPPVPCRAGICVLVNDDAGSRERRAFSRQESVTLLQQAHGVRLAHRSRPQKARRPARKFCRTACWRFSRQPKRVVPRPFHSGNNRNSVPLRELPPQRGPRQFSVERYRAQTLAPPAHHMYYVVDVHTSSYMCLFCLTHLS